MKPSSYEDLIKFQQLASLLRGQSSTLQTGFTMGLAKCIKDNMVTQQANTLAGLHKHIQAMMLDTGDIKRTLP